MCISLTAAQDNVTTSSEHGLLSTGVKNDKSNNSNERKDHIIKDSTTNPSFLSSANVQYERTLSNQESFSSKSELKSAVNEYCQDPNAWVNNTKYDMYGYVIFFLQL